MSGGHLVHGMGMAWEAPAWPAITATEAQAVLARFPSAGRLTALRWHSPRPFSAASLIQTDGGGFFLKRHHQRLRSTAALREEHRFMAHLRSAGLSVPAIVPAVDGDSVVAQDEWTYELHHDAAGHDLYRDRQSWTPYLTLEHAHEAGAALARLHLAARGFIAPPRGPHPLVSSFTILPSGDPLAAAEAYVAARPSLSAFLADKPWRRELSRLFSALGEGLADRLATLPPLWTHNDWHPSNLLWSDEGRVSAIFDFGLSTRTCALHDLATAIERSAIGWLNMEGSGGGGIADVDAMRAIIAGYNVISPLSPAERDTLVRLLPLVHVEFALSEMDYFAAILGQPDNAMVAWRDYLIGHAEWFLSPAGQDFLEHMADRAGN